MPRRRRYPPLKVLLNNRLVGHLQKDAGGALSFRYDDKWLQWDRAMPVSLSLPLREDAYRGEPVVAVFDNLLPDSDALRRRVAEQVGAAGRDAWSLLAAIGRDCVGAMQFVADDDDPVDTLAISGEPLSDSRIEAMLRSLPQAPLGLHRDDAFRISVAGVQEKTSLLFHAGRWMKPRGTTPTTHLLKVQIGKLPNGMDLSSSVENEYYCLKLLQAFGLAVNRASIATFGETKALVVERFDRRWTGDGRLLRLPQEDLCQALSIPPTRKYQSDGGPGLVQILDLLRGSDTPEQDQRTVFMAQILFWLIGATDGHAKNFSIFLGPGSQYRLTPLYDVLSAQPSLDTGWLPRRHMRLAMSVGHRRHYRIDETQWRHFLQSAEAARTSRLLATDVIDDLIAAAGSAIDATGDALPPGFPHEIHDAISGSLKARLHLLARSHAGSHGPM